MESNNKIEILERALKREKAARKAAESILEQKSYELYNLSEELKVSNEKLAESLSQKTSELEGVFFNIIDAYIVMDIMGNVLSMNDAAIEMLGYDVGIESFNLNAIVKQEYVDYTKKAFKELYEKGFYKNYQAIIKSKNNEEKLVQVNSSIIYDKQGKPIAAQGILRDITQENIYKELIEQQKKQLDIIVDHSPIGISLSRKDDIGLTKANNSLTKMLGFSHEEFKNINEQFEQRASYREIKRAVVVSSQDIHKIVDIFTKQQELDRYSRMVGLGEIASNDYNLNIPRYIDSSEPEDLHDLSAHLSGGIPNRDIEALNAYWQVFPSIRASLFKEAREGYCEAQVAANEVKSTILNHQEFKAFANTAIDLFHNWKQKADLKALDVGQPPKEVIKRISESLLNAFAFPNEKAPLLDKYDIYQIIMDYWADTLQDDVYVITQDGWQAGNSLRELVVKKGEKLKETPDLIIGKVKYKAELIPPALIVARFFQDEQATIAELQAAQDASTQAVEAYIEEHSIEDGLLADAMTDAGKVSKASVTARQKLVTDLDEVAALKKVKKLIEAEAAAKKAVKTAQEALDAKIFAKYPELTLEENKTLIVDDKWLATLEANIIAEVERITQQLANRVKTLEERYSEPMPSLVDEVATLSNKVDEHLQKMGLEW